MEIESLRLFDVLEKYAELNSKALLIYIPCWENESDEMKQEIVDFYRDKMPEEIINSLPSGQMRIIEYPNFDIALLNANLYFPYVEAIEDINPKYRIDCYIVDEMGKTCWHNK